jgi:hypothetical protein
MVSSGRLRRVVLTRATRRNIPEDTILHSHRRENLKSPEHVSTQWRRDHCLVLPRIEPLFLGCLGHGMLSSSVNTLCNDSLNVCGNSSIASRNYAPTPPV